MLRVPPELINFEFFFATSMFHSLIFIGLHSKGVCGVCMKGFRVELVDYFSERREHEKSPA